MVTIYQLIWNNNPEDTHPQDMNEITVKNLNKMEEEQEMVSISHLHMKDKRITTLVIIQILHGREIGHIRGWTIKFANSPHVLAMAALDSISMG
jgi:predicted N-acetyltransferase YhbS